MSDNPLEDAEKALMGVAIAAASGDVVDSEALGRVARAAVAAAAVALNVSYRTVADTLFQLAPDDAEWQRVRELLDVRANTDVEVEVDGLRSELDRWGS